MAIPGLGIHIDYLSGTANAENQLITIAPDSAELDSARFNEDEAIRWLPFQEERLVRGIGMGTGKRENLGAVSRWHARKQGDWRHLNNGRGSPVCVPRILAGTCRKGNLKGHVVSPTNLKLTV